MKYSLQWHSATAYSFLLRILLLFLVPLLWACNKAEEQPTNLPPSVVALPPAGITRTSAVLQGRVTENGGKVSRMVFNYGATPQMELAAVADWTDDGDVAATVTGLKAATQYYVQLHAGDEQTLVSSEQLAFTTSPLPTVQALPATEVTRFSATLNGALVDIDSADVRRCVFHYGATPQMEQRATATGSLQVKAFIDGLHHGTTYYYALEIGYDDTLAVSSMATLTTEARLETGFVWVDEPGTLEQLFTDEEMAEADTLLVGGRLNGDDLRFLRRMLGYGLDGHTTDGHLSVIDMSDVQIVSGGAAYDGMHFSSAGVIGTGLFAGCTRLKALKLPQTAVSIEAEAFTDCKSLKELVLPGSLQQVAPSSGCDSLLQIVIAAGGDELFSTVDGTLFDKQRQVLVWHPQGLTADYVVPASVKRIGNRAFSGSACAHVVLGAALQSIEAEAFSHSSIETMILPDGVQTLSSGTFQGCDKLRSLTLGSEMMVLGDYVVSGCPLTELHVRAADFLPQVQPQTFAGAEELYEQCTLYVPKKCKTRYRNHGSWGRFQRIVEE